MKTLNTSSGDYTAKVHSPSAYDSQSDRLCKSFCVGKLKNIGLLTRVARRTVKCYPKFNPV